MSTLTQNKSLTGSGEWKALEDHWQQMQSLHMRDMFSADPDRSEQMSMTGCGILLDYSKNRITSETLGLLFGLARSMDLPEWIDRMFRGEPINST